MRLNTAPTSDNVGIKLASMLGTDAVASVTVEHRGPPEFTANPTTWVPAEPRFEVTVPFVPQSSVESPPPVDFAPTFVIVDATPDPDAEDLGFWDVSRLNVPPTPEVDSPPATIDEVDFKLSSLAVSKPVTQPRSINNLPVAPVVTDAAGKKLKLLIAPARDIAFS